MYSPFITIVSCILFASNSEGISWSPDGSRFAFGESGIYVQGATNGVATKIAEGILPVWSPTENKVVFEKTINGGTRALFVISVIDLQERFLIEGHTPAWSPDGMRVAFVKKDSSTVDIDENIFAIDIDGTNLERISTNPSRGQFSGLSWWPDGNRISFCLTRGSLSFRADPYYIDLGTGDRVDLPSGVGIWSPDYSQFALSGFVA